MGYLVGIPVSSRFLEGHVLHLFPQPIVTIVKWLFNRPFSYANIILSKITSTLDNSLPKFSCTLTTKQRSVSPLRCLRLATKITPHLILLAAVFKQISATILIVDKHYFLTKKKNICINVRKYQILILQYNTNLELVFPLIKQLSSSK